MAAVEPAARVVVAAAAIVAAAAVAVAIAAVAAVAAAAVAVAIAAAAAVATTAAVAAVAAGKPDRNVQVEGPSRDGPSLFCPASPAFGPGRSGFQLRQASRCQTRNRLWAGITWSASSRKLRAFASRSIQATSRRPLSGSRARSIASNAALLSLVNAPS